MEQMKCESAGRKKDKHISVIEYTKINRSGSDDVKLESNDVSK